MAPPVRLPPGRARLATNPVPTGSAPTLKTIGIVEVALSSPASRSDSEQGLWLKRATSDRLGGGQLSTQGRPPALNDFATIRSRTDGSCERAGCQRVYSPVTALGHN